MEKLSKVAWQKMYGRSVGFRAPGMFETLLSRKAANAGGSVVLINPYAGRLSQRCVRVGREETSVPACTRLPVRGA